MSSNIFWCGCTLLLSPMVIFSVQCLLNRVLRTKSPQFLTMVSMVLGCPLFFAILSWLPFEQEETFAFYLYLFLLYSFTAYTYFHLFNMGETSRRIRILAAISNHPPQTLKELERTYDEDRMIRARLDRLVALGQIREEKGTFYPQRRLFALTARIFYCISCLLGRPWAAIDRYRAVVKNG